MSVLGPVPWFPAAIESWPARATAFKTPSPSLGVATRCQEPSHSSTTGARWPEEPDAVPTAVHAIGSGAHRIIEGGRHAFGIGHVPKRPTASVPRLCESSDGAEVADREASGARPARAPISPALCAVTGCERDQREPFHDSANDFVPAKPTASQNVGEAQDTSVNVVLWLTWASAETAQRDPSHIVTEAR